MARFYISQSFENGLRPKVGSGGGGWGSGESGALLVSVCDAVTPGESEGGQLISPVTTDISRHPGDGAVSVAVSVIITRITQSMSVSALNMSVTFNITEIFIDTVYQLPIVKCQFHFQY